MASGAKLPAPISMNALLRCYKGPVLVAQGVLDPLNDALTRAQQLGNIREGINVELMQLGHCPMDEDPKQCAEAVLKWWNAVKDTPTPALFFNTSTSQASVPCITK